MEKVNYDSIRDFLEHKVQNCRILVLGDVMLDQYFYGTVTRISPEAPVPINLIKRQENKLGGSANVAHNLARLGCQVFLSGVIADDYHGQILKEQLESLHIDIAGLIYGREKTTTKARILGGHQQMIRLDFEESDFISEETSDKLYSYVESVLKQGIHAIILSDYKKGVITPALSQKVITLAHGFQVPIFVDPKGSDWEKYRGADYITPNIKELGDASGFSINNNDEEVCRACHALQRRFEIKTILSTRSEKGMSLVENYKVSHITTVAKDVFDVSGAGDTVIACFSAGVSGGLSPYNAAFMANLAAGIGVGKVGTYAVSNAEILSACLHIIHG